MLSSGPWRNRFDDLFMTRASKYGFPIAVVFLLALVAVTMSTPKGPWRNPGPSFPIAVVFLLALVAVTIVGFDRIDINVTEPQGNGEVLVLDVRVVLDQPATGVVTVDYAMEGVSADPGEDYEETSGTLTFPAGATSRTFPVEILGDDNSEEKLQLRMHLTNPSGATTGRARAVLNIEDADGLPIVSINEIDPVTEGSDSSVRYTLQLNRPAEYPFNITLGFSQQDATISEPLYEEHIVNIPNHTQTFTATTGFSVKDDNKREAPERAHILILTNREGIDFERHPTERRRDVWIIDYETPEGIHATTDDITHSVKRNHIQVPEGGSARYKIWLPNHPRRT